jgi:hypothetical protein
MVGVSDAGLGPMDSNMSRFNQRVNRIERGAAAHIPQNMYLRPDGLVAYRRPIWRPGIPWRSMILAAICILALKGFMIWHQGTDAYAERLAGLQSGTRGAQIAAQVLSMDPVSTWLAESLTLVLGAPPDSPNAVAPRQSVAALPAVPTAPSQ